MVLRFGYVSNIQQLVVRSFYWPICTVMNRDHQVVLHVQSTTASKLLPTRPVNANSATN
jgi:hypothetical protein